MTMESEIEKRLRGLPVTPLPESERVWAEVSQRLDAGNIQGAGAGAAGGAEAADDPLGVRRAPRWLVAAAVIFALLGGAVAGSVWNYRAPDAWAVASIAGVPRAGGDELRGESQLGSGDWIVTDSASAARLQVGRIGVADIGPGSRVQVERRGLLRHHLSLERGTMSAVIEAPPRLFFVRSPSALATDLGCAFTLTVDDAGNSRLEVTEGWVELSEKGRISLVPAGMAAAATTGEAPGTPYSVELPDSVVRAVKRIDDGSATDADLDLVLASLSIATAPHPDRQRSATTMWHLLQRTGGARRATVERRLNELAPRPRGVTTEGILALDRRMLDRWRADLHPMWSEEAQPFMTRVLRQLWDLAIR
jgi:hypothetical protein